MQSNPNSSRLALCLALGFAVAIQIQVTLFSSADYLGLRINIADFILPLSGIAILISLICQKSIWPNWIKPAGYWLPILLVGVLTIALINGYFIQGQQLMKWALINKYFGWFIIMAYFAAGAWIASNLSPQALIKYFFIPFAVTALIILIGELSLLYYIRGTGATIPLFPNMMYLNGLMGNRNAFALLIICVLGMLYYLFKGKKNMAVLGAFFWFLMPMFLIFNSSRILFIAGLLALAIFLITDWRGFTKKCLPYLFLGLIPLGIFFKITPNKQYFDVTYRSTKSLVEYVQKQDDPEVAQLASNYGNDQRVTILKQAWSLIQTYPIQGAGLGSVLFFQEQEHGKPINIIDSSPVWVMTEMGLIGVFGFGAAYIAIIVALRRKIMFAATEEEKAIAQCAAFMVFAFSLFCLFHEILYTRFFWLILGLTLVSPLKIHLQKSKPLGSPDPILEDPAQNPTLSRRKT